MTQIESPKRKMQKKNDYQRHKLFRKIKRKRKAQAEAEQQIAQKQLMKKLKLPKFDTGDDSRMVYLRDIVRHDPYTGQDILKTGERVSRRLPAVNVNQRDLSKVDAAERNKELRDLKEYMGDAAFDKYMSDLQTKKDIQNAQYQKTWQGEVADAIDGGMTALALHPTTQPAADMYFALRGAKELSNGNPYGVLGMVPVAGNALPEIKNVAKQIYFSNNPNAQYLRYIGGKIKYGLDAQFPDLYRRYSILPDMSQKYTIVSPINSRFAYESGDVSPLISNFTTDYPVLPNNGGDWSTRPILRFPGKTLLGKNVISTRPSDTFTFGENIKVPTKNIQVFNQNTNQKLREAFELMQKNAGLRKSGRFLLEKPRDYGSEFEQALLEEATKANRPRLKDYQFMDYVFRPKYTSQVHDADILNSKNLPEDLLDALNNTQSRGQLFDGHYKNVVYNPASPVESQFRESVGIVERNKIPTNKRKFNSGKDIYIKKSKRGTFTKAAKQHGMSVQGFANKVLNNPSNYSASMIKKANFAHNAASWKH